MDDGFHITWSVPSRAWAHVKRLARLNPPGSFYDQALGMIYSGRELALEGRIQCRHGNTDLYPREWGSRRGKSDGVRQSVVQLAVQLAAVVPAMQTLPEGRTMHLGDGGSDARVYFRRSDGMIELRTRVSEAGRISCPLDRFVEGASVFVTDFWTTLFLHAPMALQWETLEPLAEFAAARMAEPVVRPRPFHLD